MGRPLTPRLSRKAIGREAMALFIEEGGLSIPRLAERLGVRQSSFYKHVSGRQEIIELARGHLVDMVPAPTAALQNLDAVVRHIFEALRTAYTRVPALLPELLIQPVTNPAALELYDKFAKFLERAGCPAHLVIPTIEVIDSAAIGASLDVLSMENAWSIEDQDRPKLPHLTAAQQAVKTHHVDRFSFLADVLAAGLQAVTMGDSRSEDAAPDNQIGAQFEHP